MTSPTEAIRGAARLIEVADITLHFRPIAIADKTPTGDQILAACDVSPREEYVVLEISPGGDIEEVRRDEIVELTGTGPTRFIVAKSDRLLRLVIDDRSISWPTSTISAAALRELGGVHPEAEIFLRREEEEDRLIERESDVTLGDLGVEVFYSKKATWKLNVQGVVIDSVNPTIVVRDALVAAGFNPDQGWIIVLKASDSKKQVALTDVIDLRAPGVEKLRLTPREINNGEVNDVLRRDFKLLTTDEAGLDARGLQWETVIDAGRRWLVISDYALPPGFSATKATIALDIPPAYPSAEIDMFYCMPHLAKANGQAIAQTQATATIRGQHYQRWSRHRGPGAPWRPGADSVLTHLTLVDAAILREVEHD